MCKSREAAKEACFAKYGHRNISQEDYGFCDCYYSAPEDMEWAIPPDDFGDPGVLVARSGAMPLCRITQHPEGGDQ